MALIETQNFKNKPPFQQLDFVLHQFVKNDKFKGNITDGAVIKELFGKLKIGEIAGSIIIEILVQLCEDKYLYREIRENTYHYTLNF